MSDIYQTTCTSLKRYLFSIIASHTLKIALYTNSATLNATTDRYTTTGESSGPGYTAGGINLENVLTSYSGDIAKGTVWLTFDNPSWKNSSITARGALIYDASVSTNMAIAVLDFGSDKTTVNSEFSIQIPQANSNTAIIRLA